MHRGRRPITLIAAFAACAAMFGQAPVMRAGADTIVVTTTEDELNTDGDCSLREAVMAVNTQAPVDACAGAPESRNIFVEPGEYRLTIPGAGDDAGLTGDLDVLRPMQLDLTGVGQAVIDGGELDRIFDIHPSAYPHRTVLVGIVLRNGDAGIEDGGAIRVSDVPCDGDVGSLRGVELFGVVVDTNRAARGGGLHVGGCNAVEIIGSSIIRNTATDVGGGVSIEGASMLDFDTSTVSTNQAVVAGGGIWAGLTQELFGWGLELSTVAGNRAPTGGGFWSTTSVQLNDPILASNEGGNCGGPGGPFTWAVSDDDTCGGPAVDDAGLLPLTTTSGFPVHLLGTGSPAIEAAGEPRANNWCSGRLRFDQVGTDRPLDGDGDGVAMCDAGAIEAAAVALAPGPAPSGAPLPDTATDVGESVRPQPTWLPALLVAVGVSAGLTSRLGPRRVHSR